MSKTIKTTELLGGYTTVLLTQKEYDDLREQVRRLGVERDEERAIKETEKKILLGEVEKNTQLREQVRKLTEENNENEQFFELQHTRMKEADSLWQKAHNEPHVLPDLSKLIDWLLRRAENAEREADAMAEALWDTYHLGPPIYRWYIENHAEALRLARERVARRKG
jgi:hypothetical protein